jgi:HEAT repeat protein
MTITSHIQEIGANDHKLAMRDLKPLSGLGREDREAFWPAWLQIVPMRRAEIVQSMVELVEDNIDLDFSQVLHWSLEDEDAAVRASAIEGLWEDESGSLFRTLLTMLRADPAPPVRVAAAMALSRFAYLAEIEELEEDDAQKLQSTLLESVLDQRQPFDVRRRALESAGYFSAVDEVQRQIELAYASEEQFMRESALVAMGRSMLARWLPMIGKELSSRSPALRYEAARAAGEMAENARSLVPQVAPLLTDDDTEVAFAAIWALGQIGGDAARRALQSIRKSQDEARGQAAADALEELSLGDDIDE